MKLVAIKKQAIIGLLLVSLEGMVFARTDNLCRHVVDVRASSIFDNDLAGHAPERLFDGQHQTGWGTATVKGGSVEFSLEKEKEVRRVILMPPSGCWRRLER